MNSREHRSGALNHGRILSEPGSQRCLDTLQLNRIESALREWVSSGRRSDLRRSRRRVLLIFLLIRYTGARLNEVLRFKPGDDFDPSKRTVLLRKGSGLACRAVSG